MTDPIHGASTFSWSYRADGQLASAGAPSGNTTALLYDKLGRLTSKDTTSGGTNRALYDWTYNRAGQILSEDSQVSGDPANGIAAYGYDQLGRLTAYTPPAGAATTYGWDEVPNRLSVEVDGTPAVTTTYDAANRPFVDSLGNDYVHDPDGRMTDRAGQALTWDDLGRLTGAEHVSGVDATSYTYDALDRLLKADDGTTAIRFRYVGRTTQVAQTVNDTTGQVIRSIANDWTGERLVDWTGTNSNQRFYGTNGHHDVTWTADHMGAVTNRLRYDPWGTAVSTSGASVPDFRFQGSWFDTATDLAWVVTRWYAPAQGRFVSQDSLLGEPASPPSRHLYAYGAAEPVGRWDPAGCFWYKWLATSSLRSVARLWLGSESYWPAIKNLNRNRISKSTYPFPAGRCVWVPTELWKRDGVNVTNQCTPTTTKRTGDILRERTSVAENTRLAASKVLGSAKRWYLLTTDSLVQKTRNWTLRPTDPSSSSLLLANQRLGDSLAIATGAGCICTSRVLFPPANMILVYDHALWPPAGNVAATMGHYVFMSRDWDPARLECCGASLLSHEYIHVLQWQGKGSWFASEYAGRSPFGTGPSNKLEAPGYLWEGWIHFFHQYGEAPPWIHFKPI